MSSTPLQIDIALHYWTRPTDYGRGNPDDNFDAPAVVQQRREMMEAGLLEMAPDDSRSFYRAGPALETYINALCSMPWPVQRWIVPTNRVTAE